MVLIPVVFGLSVLNIVIAAALANSVHEADSGCILGLNMAINSLIRNISPYTGGYVLTYLGIDAFGFLGALTSICVFMFLQFSFCDGYICRPRSRRSSRA